MQIRVVQQFSKWLWPLAYSCVVVAILYPILFTPGYVWLLDMVWGPTFDVAAMTRSGLPAHYPLLLLIATAATILPVWGIQKIVLVLILLVPGISMYWYVKSQFPVWVAGVSGLLYLINPWVVERFLSGQWLVLLGYGLLPLGAWYAHAWCQQPRRFRLLRWYVWWLLLPVVSIHWWYVATLISLPLGMVILVRQLRSVSGTERRVWLIRSIIYSILALVVWYGVHWYWLHSFQQGGTTYAAITWSDFGAYQTVAAPDASLFTTALAGYGFWDQQYILPRDSITWWWMVGWVWFSLTLIGVGLAVWQRRTALVVIGVVSIVGLVLGLGSTSVAQPLLHWLFAVVPGFSGLRETSKLLGLLMFGYAVLVPWVVYKLSQWLPRIQYMTVRVGSIVIVLLLVGTAQPMLGGFAGQLQSHEYPASWYQARAYVQTHVSDGVVLVLPWEAYPVVSFAGYTRVSNPARVFFDVPVLQSDALYNAYTVASELDQIHTKMIAELVHGFVTVADVPGYFQQHNIQYVLLLKEGNWQQYDFVYQSPQLKTALDTDDLVLFEYSVTE